MGGHTWRIGYYPSGTYAGYQHFISAGLYLVDHVAEPVKVRATFSILDHGMKSKIYSRPPTTFTFSKLAGRCHGYETFVTRRGLRKRLNKQDCFALRVDLFIIKEEEPASIVLPPSDMHHHLGDLLSSKDHTDVEFRVGEETFVAHRLLLGARSPVFKAEFSGDRKTTKVIQVDDMEPQVFKAMLTFIYTDTWPKVALQKESAMAQRLLVAADRYGLQRLKSMCEYRLCNHIDLGSVEHILLLAEKHQCAALREACFDFIGSTATLVPARENILTLRRTQELRFDRLVSLCPTITKDQIFNVLDRESDRKSIGSIDITLDIE